MGRLIVERMRDRHPRWGPMDDEFHDENTHWAGQIRCSLQGPIFLNIKVLEKNDSLDTIQIYFFV